MTKNKLVLLIVGVLLFALFFRLGSIELRAEEPRRATVSMEMIFSGDYYHPHLNDWRYYNKPPVFNWVQIFFMKLFGSFEEWVARIPSLLSFLLIGFLQFKWAKRYVEREVALLSSLFFLLSADILFYGAVNSGEIDLFYTLLVYAQIMSLFIFYQKMEYLKMFLVSYLFVTLGALTKGPPSIAFQGLTLIGMTLYYKDWKLLFRWQHFLAGGLFLLITGGYFYGYHSTGDGWAYVHRLLKEASQRTGLEVQWWKTALGVLQYPANMLALIAPAAILAIFLFKKGTRSLIRVNPFISFSVLFVLFNIWIYWITGDFKARYNYIFVPFIILILVFVFMKHRTVWTKVNKGLEYLLGGVIVALGVVIWSLPFVPETAKLDSVYLIAGILSLVFFGIGFLYFKAPKLRIYYFLLTIAVARLGFDFIYPPLVNADPNLPHFRSVLADLFEKSEGASFEYTGHSQLLSQDSKIGPFDVGEITQRVPPLLSYQLCYYYGKVKHEPLRFVELENLVPGRLYIGQSHLINGPRFEQLYEFKDSFGNPHLLCRFLE